MVTLSSAVFVCMLPGSIEYWGWCCTGTTQAVYESVSYSVIIVYYEHPSYHTRLNRYLVGSLECTISSVPSCLIFVLQQ